MNFYTNVQIAGNKVLYRGVEDGKRIQRKLDYRPTLFHPCKEKSEYKTVKGEYLAKINPGDLRESRDYLSKYKDVSTFPIYGQTRFEYCFISDRFRGHIDWHKELIIQNNIDVEVDSEDGFPEPEKADQPITAITFKRNDHFYAYGIGEFKSDRNDLTYVRCKDEIDLLEKFLDEWCRVYPDIITGWNVRFFDIPYLINRITNVLGEDQAKRMSPWNNLRMEKIEYMGREKPTYRISGVATWDYLELLRKYATGGRSHESYKLDAIAFDILGKKKVSYAEYGNLRNLYRQNHQLFMEYNISDVELVGEIDDKEKLIDLCLTLAYDAKCNFDDVFAQVRMWDVLIYNHLRDKKMVMSPNVSHSKDEKYIGAYVKDPLVGMHNWIASYDLTSLYPHLIMQFNISPDTIIEPYQYGPEIRELISKYKISIDNLLTTSVDCELPLQISGATMTPNGQFFSLDRHGFLPEMMETMFNDRSKYKKLMIEAQKEYELNKTTELSNKITRYNNLQMAKKVCLNSAYGALGNQYFRYFDVRQAAAITTAGQLVIRWIADRLNKYLNSVLKTDTDYIIASDTDSVYINLQGIVKLGFGDKLATTDKVKVIAFMDKICKERISPLIDQSCQDLGKYLNVYAQKMDMKREALADKGIWTAKKRYILNVYNSEGVQYAEPKIKISGLESIKSSTPTACRQKLKDAIKVIMNGTEADVIKYISEFKKTFKTLPLEEIAFPRSVNGVSDYADNITTFVKGSPMHVKAALFYNKALKEKGLTNQYELIREGEKIKFIQLIEPNPFGNEVIAFTDKPPPELGIEKYVDYNTQFEKSFIDPLKIILDCIGWKTEKTNSLMKFARKT